MSDAKLSIGPESASDSCLGTVACLLVIIANGRLQIATSARFDSINKVLNLPPSLLFPYCHC